MDGITKTNARSTAGSTKSIDCKRIIEAYPVLLRPTTLINPFSNLFVSVEIIKRE
jgi:hypothetical protein